ncbi:hypothetical protein HYU10_03120 [Candidatus Woesearchaeota archaeon]|nr:hypothetical protein [Candidatus Woesearchaeota archaeon]
MGILDFLKKSKSKNRQFEALDAPPLMPPMEKAGAGMGDLEPINFDLPPEDGMKGENLPSMKSFDEGLPSAGQKAGTQDDEFSGLPDFSDFDSKFPGAIPEKKPESHLPSDSLDEDLDDDLEGEDLEASGLRAYQHRKGKKTSLRSIYLNLSDLKNVLLNVKKIRVGLKNAQDIVLWYDETRIRQEKTYARLNNLAHDMQKKFIYLDKSIYKGEKL